MKMRILYIPQTTDAGGASIALKNIILEIKTVADVAVLLPSNKGWLVDVLCKYNVQMFFSEYEMMVYPISCIRQYGYWNPLGYLKFIKGVYNKYYRKMHAKRDLAKIIQTFQPNIVHCNCSLLDFSFEVCQQLRVPHVWHIREYIPFDNNMHVMPSLSYHKQKLHHDGNFSIAITKGIFDYFELRKDVDKVIYDGVFEESHGMKDFPKKNYFLSVGRIEASKGTLFLIDAFAKFHHRHPEVKLLFAGGFPNQLYFETCKNRIKKYHIEDAVSFLGFRDDVQALMQHAIGLIVASPNEGFGFITAEAMLNYCLVIGRNTAGTKEQFDNGLYLMGEEIGLRYESQDELIEQMEYVLAHKGDKMRELAYQAVIKQYTIKAHVQKLLAFYHKILSSYK